MSLGDTVPDRHGGTIPSNRARRAPNYSSVTSSMTDTTCFKNQHEPHQLVLGEGIGPKKELKSS